jgi:glycosyltransferase involved in cell wall biosynthesis
LLVPSLWEEPGGRVAAEALLNGIPPIASDRGALPEIVKNAGFVIPIKRKLFDHSPVTPEEIAPWVSCASVAAGVYDTPAYEEMIGRAYKAGKRYDSVLLTPLYNDFFESVLAGKSVPTGTTAAVMPPASTTTDL